MFNRKYQKIPVQDWFFFVHQTTQLLKFEISLDWKYLRIIEKLKIQKFKKNETRKIDNWVQNIIYGGFWNSKNPRDSQPWPKPDPDSTQTGPKPWPKPWPKPDPKMTQTWPETDKFFTQTYSTFCCVFSTLSLYMAFIQRHDFSFHENLMKTFMKW